MNVSFLISSLALVSASSAFAVHDDDPKILDREAPYVGPAYRRAQLGAPGGLSGVPTGSQALAGGGFDSNGVSLLSWLPLGEFGSPQSGADCWGYTSPSGREYGLMGHYDGMTVIEVTNPFDAQVVDTIPSTSSLWHDVKVYQDKAYVCNEGGGGVQVVDLSNVDNGVVSVVGNITSGGSTTTHNVFINEDSGYLYRTGGSDNGLRIYDLNASLTNPPLVASWSTRYVHDAQIVTYFSGPYAGKEIAFCNSGFNGGSVQTGLDILDVTNKNSIQVLANVDYDNAGYSHQGWLSPDRQYFYLNDEFDENGSLPTTTYVMDVSNLSNPFQASKFDNGNQAVGHNLYMKDNLIYEANYRSGLRVFDATDALNPTEVAFFDTYPGSDSNSYNGLWSIYPFFESGTIIGSDLERGFFVWIMGEVPLTLNLPQGAPNLVDPAGESLAVTVTEDTPGNYASGTGMLHVEVGGVWTSYPMIDQGGGNLTANFPSLPCGTSFNYYVSADSTTGGTWAEPSLAPAELFSAVSGVGITTLISDEMTSVGTWNSGVPTDDATTGMWELVNPNGTAAQPEDDHTPSGTTCWVTGQGSAGGSLGDNDVDDGMNT
ncbi:MAG: choice-of-anchor B domain-containing protein, partial [Planctomycetota bacterium]